MKCKFNFLIYISALLIGNLISFSSPVQAGFFGKLFPGNQAGDYDGAADSTATSSTTADAPANVNGVAVTAAEQASYDGSPNHRTTYVAPSGGTCRASCSGSGTVKVDVTARCMCISGSKCFTVDIGYNGPSMTTNGHGTLGVAQGVKYHTYPGNGLTSLNRGGARDNDAISMGIEANNRYGKWIHKSRSCGANGNSTQGGRTNTAGCIAIPCAYWPEVKAQMGQSLDVCNGSATASSVGGGTRRRSSGRSGGQ